MDKNCAGDPQPLHPEENPSLMFSSPEQLGFTNSPLGSEVLKTRAEQVRFFSSARNHLICQVITTFNTLMEESQSGVERMRKVVMKEAEQVVARIEAAEARRQEELKEEMAKMVTGLEKDFEEIVDQVGFVVDLLFLCQYDIAIR